MHTFALILGVDLAVFIVVTFIVALGMGDIEDGLGAGILLVLLVDVIWAAVWLIQFGLT
jgi:hypothetical protein